MKTMHYKDVPPTLFNNDMARNVAGRVMIGKDDGEPNFCMRVFELGENGHTPMHTHDWEHEIFVHAGEGAVFDDGTWKDVVPGMAVFIPGNVVHQIKNTGASPLVVVCLLPEGAPEL